jgi:hypothetical protein
LDWGLSWISPRKLAKDPTGRYFALHVFANAYVTLVHADDVWRAMFSDPIESPHTLEPCDASGIVVIYAIHLYHIALFRPLPWIDWVHHGLMVLFMLPLAYLVQPGPLLGNGGFWSSGLPGGLDYAMLVAVKLGYMRSIEEKRINSYIQTWIRAPGCLFQSGLTYIAYMEGVRRREAGGEGAIVFPNSLLSPTVTTASIVLVIAAFFWNGMFFQKRVCVNYGMRCTEGRLQTPREKRLQPHRTPSTADVVETRGC